MGTTSMDEDKNADSGGAAACPLCIKTEDCEHLLLRVDLTFGEALGGVLLEKFEDAKGAYSNEPRDLKQLLEQVASVSEGEATSDCGYMSYYQKEAASVAKGFVFSRPRPRSEAPISATLRPLIAQMEVAAPARTSPGAKLAVIVDCGHSDVGSCTENGVEQEVSTIEEAQALLADRRETVLGEFLAEVDLLHFGIQEGTLIDDGGGYYFVAQIVTPEQEPQFGEDVLRPVAGVAVWWWPWHSEKLEVYDWADQNGWDDWFGEPEAVEKPVILDWEMESYKKTKYVIFTEPPFTLRLGKASRELASLYAREKVESASIITAWRTSYSRSTNDAWQEILIAEVNAQGFRYLLGEGRTMYPGWGTKSLNYEKMQCLLILGMTETEAMALGKRVLQNAVLWSGRDAVPKLVTSR